MDDYPRLGPVKMTSFSVLHVDWNEHKQHLKEIRRDVFIEEQGVPQSDEWDGLDEEKNSLHFLAWSDTQAALGCIRLVIVNKGQSIKLTRLAVLPRARRIGVGTKLVQEALKVALDHAPQEIYLNAQVSAKNYYLNFGFVEDGNIFDEAGIAHQRMYLGSLGFNHLTHIYDEQIIRFQSNEQLSTHLSRLIRASRRHIIVSTSRLNETIFTDRNLIDNLSHFVRKDKTNELRVLIQKANALYGKNVPLITLAKRLSSKIKVHSLHNNCPTPPQSFMSFDQHGLIFFNDEENLSGFVCYQARAECANLSETFNHAWQHLSAPDPNFSQFLL